MDFLTLIVLLLGGFASGFIGSIVGGGGLIVIPMLMFLGLPPHSAIATSKFGAVGLVLGALRKYSQSKKVQWKLVYRLIPLAFLGSIVGSSVLISMDEGLLTNIVGIFILMLLPLVLWKGRIGLVHSGRSRLMNFFGYILFFVSMAWGAFFGGGGGIINMSILAVFFGLTWIESSATTKVPWLVMSVTALLVFAINGLIHWAFGLVLFFSMGLGGVLGAKTAIRKGNNWVRILLIVMVVVSAVKILFF